MTSLLLREWCPLISHSQAGRFCREYLVKNKIAAPGKVAINGGSNGGELCYACACSDTKR